MHLSSTSTLILVLYSYANLQLKACDVYANLYQFGHFGLELNKYFQFLCRLSEIGSESAALHLQSGQRSC